MKVLHKVSNVLDKITLTLIGVLLTVMTVVYFAQVVVRFVFNSGLYWSEELVRYSCIAMVYFAAASLFKIGGHVAITVLEEMLPLKARKYQFVILSIISIVYMVLVFVIGLQILQVAGFQQSPNMRIPMNIIYLLFPISAAIMIVHTISNLTNKATYSKYNKALPEGKAAK